MSKREELESKIREQRVLEATKKGLVGFSGKIGTVLKVLGQEIVSQDFDGDLFEENEETPKNNRDLMLGIPTIDMDENYRPVGEEWAEIEKTYYSSIRKIGLHFDGLNRGMHMEIKYDDETSELYLTHKGYLVYKECMGEIECYVPNEEWEGWIDRLWQISKKIQREKKEVEFEEKALNVEKEKQAWWSSLVKKWGNF